MVLTFVWWWTTRWEALLLLVATQVLQMVQQLMPLLRFDGYHLLADLAGVPDLYHRIRPTLLGLLPHRWFHPENRVLKPWARAVITAWVLVTIPMMALMLLALVTAVPRLLGTRLGRRAARTPAACLPRGSDGGLVDATRPGAPGAGRGAARAGGLPDPGPHRAAVVPRTRHAGAAGRRSSGSPPSRSAPSS